MRKFRCVLFVLVTVVFGSVGYAVPTIDGFFDSSEGYASGYNVEYRLDNGQVVGTGQLWTFQDASTNDLYAALVAPRSIVDNSYGENSIGWKEKNAMKGPKGKKGKKGFRINYGHKFSDLLCSDKASFVISDGSGNVVIDFDLDYIAIDDTSTSGYSSLGILDGPKSDGGLNNGSAEALLEWGTSLDYNFNKLGYVLTEHSPYADSDYENVDENYADWVFDVVYEFRIDGSYLDGGDYRIGGLLSHVSPAKTNFSYIEIVTPVPAPGAVLLAGLGTVCAGWMRRRNILK